MAARDVGLEPPGRALEAGDVAADSSVVGSGQEAGSPGQANARLLESDDFGALLGRLVAEDWPPAIDGELARLGDLLRPGLNDLQLAALESSFLIDER